MIIKWGINHIDLLEESKSSNIDMGEGRWGTEFVSLFGLPRLITSESHIVRGCFLNMKHYNDNQQV